VFTADKCKHSSADLIDVGMLTFMLENAVFMQKNIHISYLSHIQVTGS